jgi:hypothetical protein
LRLKRNSVQVKLLLNLFNNLLSITIIILGDVLILFVFVPAVLVTLVLPALRTGVYNPHPLTQFPALRQLFVFFNCQFSEPAGKGFFVQKNLYRQALLIEAENIKLNLAKEACN